MFEYPVRLHRLIRASAAVALAAALLSGVAMSGPALAAVRGDPVPTQGYIYISCDSMPCQQQLYRVPANRRLRLIALSCAAETRDPGGVAHIGVRRQSIGGDEQVVDISSNRVGVQGDTQYYAFRAADGAFVDGGETVNAFVESGTAVDSFYCFLAGDLTEIR